MQAPLLHTCDICKQSFQSLHGMRIHRSSAHRQEANDETSRNILRRLNVRAPPETADGTGTNENTILANQHCKKWNNIFSAYARNVPDIDLNQLEDDVKNFLKFLADANSSLPGPKHPAIKYYRLRKKNSTVTIQAKIQKSATLLDLTNMPDNVDVTGTSLKKHNTSTIIAGSKQYDP